MKQSLNIYGQTTEWEHACVHTRRNTESRKKRLLQFSFRPDDKILDLGCGDGVNIQVLRSMGMTSGGQRHDAKLTQEGAAELYWAMLIGPVQPRR